jgi:hypothetical protein
MTATLTIPPPVAAAGAGSPLAAPVAAPAVPVPAGGQTPGEAFAGAVAAAGAGTDVALALARHLPAAFPLFASRPRYTVRHLMKTATCADGPTPYVHEPAKGSFVSGVSYETTPEATFVARLRDARMTDLTVRVQAPAGVGDHPDLMARFVDYRVLVRLSALENEALLHGTADGALPGLLPLASGRTFHGGDGLERAVTRAAAEVEETGGSCDGIVAHPFAYWEMVRTGLLGRLAQAGITVSRTRMIPRDRLLLGDFRAAFTLLLPQVGSLRLLLGGGGTPDVIEASTRVGLAVHLPQHLVSLTWEDGRG